MSNNTNPKQQIVVSLELVGAMLQYLMGRPFSEVDNLVATLRKEAGPQVEAIRKAQLAAQPVQEVPANAQKTTSETAA